MNIMVKSWFRYFIFVCFFGIGINMLYLSIPLYLMVVTDKVLFSFSIPTLAALTTGILFTLGVMGILTYLRSRLLVKAGSYLEKELTPHVLATMHADAAHAAGTAYDRGLEDLECIKDAVHTARILVLIDLPWVIIYFALLYLMHPVVAAVAACGFFISGMFYLLVRILCRPRYVSADSVFAANKSFVAETLDNAEFVSGMGLLPEIIQRYRAKQEKAGAMTAGAESFRAAADAVIAFISAVTIAGVYGAGAYLFFAHHITAGFMLAVVFVTARLFAPLGMNLAGLRQSLQAAAAYNRLKKYVNTSKKKPSIQLPRPEGRLTVENAVLVLNGRQQLQNISFGLEPGEALGIIGPMGSGKSLLLKLILGIWAPTAGKVRLDGADTAQWDREDLGPYIGYVPQRTDLFSGRVDDNIARLKAIDSEQVIKASKKAFVHEMVLGLPNGYDTLVGNAGDTLSQGQCRRIAFARALYGDPKLVVMDRPNSDLDEEGMRALLQAMEGMKNEKTTLVMVTENPNLLVNTDKILFLKDGQVVMFGPAKEVLTKLKTKQPVQQG